MEIPRYILQKNLQIAKLLIDNGADVNAINNENQTPYDTIVSEKVKRLIQEKGGKPGHVFKFKEKIPELKKESLWTKVKNLF